MRSSILVAVSVALAACSPAPNSTAPPETGPGARIILVGDVMLGRGVAGVIEADESSVFADVRHLIAGADIAAANLESPLTTRPHVSESSYALEADPAVATLLASTGFDLMSLPNNHSNDAGGEGLLDTVAALDAAGIEHVGAGPEVAAATVPAVFSVSGLEVGFLAFDTTDTGVTVGNGAATSRWDDAASPALVAEVRRNVDVLVVSLHGGTEYLPTTDPQLAAIADVLSAVGVDIVWGHGAHVVQPVAVTTGNRPTVVATSLGNFLFDQFGSDRTTGYLLEVLVDNAGVAAYRVGLTEHADRRVEFVEWLEPTENAGFLDGGWWSLTREPTVAASTSIDPGEFHHGDLVTARRGDIDGNGSDDVIASFRRPFRSTAFMETHPEVQWTDTQGRSAHLGVYESDGLTEIWVAGSVVMPIAVFEVCAGSLAVVHDRLDDATHVASGAWTWNGFGFDTAPTLAGDGTPACADLDGDGRTEPVILNRD